LRIAVLQRDEQWPALHNLEEVGSLVAEYTHEPLQAVVVHDKLYEIPWAYALNPSFARKPSRLVQPRRRRC